MLRKNHGDSGTSQAPVFRLISNNDAIKALSLSKRKGLYFWLLWRVAIDTDIHYTSGIAVLDVDHWLTRLGNTKQSDVNGRFG